MFYRNEACKFSQTDLKLDFLLRRQRRRGKLTRRSGAGSLVGTQHTGYACACGVGAHTAAGCAHAGPAARGATVGDLVGVYACTLHRRQDGRPHTDGTPSLLGLCRLRFAHPKKLRAARAGGNRVTAATPRDRHAAAPALNWQAAVLGCVCSRHPSLALRLQADRLAQPA